MAKELEYQKKICESLMRQGGHGRKWASEYQVGVPDLILSHPACGGLWLAEVKMLKIRDVVAFRRRGLGVTPRQRDELRKYRDAGAQVCLIVIAHEAPGRAVAISRPWWSTHLEHDDLYVPSSSSWWCGPGTAVVNNRPHGFDIVSIMQGVDTRGDAP